MILREEELSRWHECKLGWLELGEVRVDGWDNKERKWKNEEQRAGEKECKQGREVAVESEWTCR